MTIPKISLRYAYALHILATRGEMYATQLARVLGVNPVTVSNMVNSMEPKGYIEFYHKKEQRNKLWLTVTEKGKALIEGLFK